MNKKAVALLSGGLDSMLAICLIKDQGVEIEAINFQTIFGCCKDDARRAAYDLGVGFTMLKVGDDYLKMVEKPKYGYGRGINPCVDCRAYMFEMARRHMDHTGASFMISGEVLGQRPMSQKMSDFRSIEKETGMEGKIVRPLSGKLLPPTLPEQAGILDRSRFESIQGRSRARLLELARHYGIENPPQPSSGCALTSPDFAKKVRDIFKYHKDYQRWEFEILKMGRHFRLSEKTKVIIARNQDENQFFEYLHPEGTVLLSPENFVGPTALLIGEKGEDVFRQTASMMMRYGDKPLPETGRVLAEYGGRAENIEAANASSEEELVPLRIV